MEDMLKRIIEMDKKAQKLDKKNQSKRENLEKEISQQVASIREEYMDNAKKTVAENDLKIQGEAQEKWEADKKKREAVIKRLNDNAEANKEQWVNTIVERVLA